MLQSWVFNTMRLVIVVFLSAISYGQSELLHDTLCIQFDYDSYQITAKEKDIIDIRLSDSLSGKIKKIILIGHTDSDGDSGYNKMLSLNRAKAVKNLIKISGSPSIQIEVEGKGENEPIATNESEKGKAENRRVEIILMYQELPEISGIIEIDEFKEQDLKVGNKVLLRNLNFIGGRHYILNESVPVLDKLLKLLLDNPTLEIEIQGHICCTSGHIDGYDFDTKTYNLSENRAKAIYDFLIDNGIDSSRLKYKGMKGNYHLVEEITEEDKKTNRRVEFVITKL